MAKIIHTIYLMIHIIHPSHKMNLYISPIRRKPNCRKFRRIHSGANGSDSSYFSYCRFPSPICMSIDETAIQGDPTKVAIIDRSFGPKTGMNE